MHATPAQDVPAETKRRVRNNDKELDDEELIEWYFCEGKSSFARSVMGPMLSRAELYRHGSFPCYKCEDSPGITENGDWCRRCNGTGFKSFELYGTKEPLTARPTAEVTETRGYEPNILVLQRYGEVARRMEAVRATCGQLGVRALEAFYGDMGARWGNTKHGRLFAVYPLTKAGRKLLLRGASKNDPIELTPCESLGVQAELQAAQPKLWRRDGMEQASVQAKKIYLDALAAFCATEEPKRRSAPTGEAKRTRRDRKAEAWLEGAPGAKENGFKYEYLKNAAGF